ncbi:hypothetical protein ACIG3E_14320 [Streptomyces sp. NPDC053474]|uniref:hypothetical protein n=1 Tax=Streptomyces sp. NPDC053474 TaxID=3365704 RepID=UPI0037D797A3
MASVTELRPVDGPVVYGFLRLIRVPEARQDALLGSLAEYCRRHELRLSGTFADRADAGAVTPAFTGLLDALSAPGAYGVVLPAFSHLGPKAIATKRRRGIDAAGVRLLLVRDTRPSSSRRATARPWDEPSRCRTRKPTRVPDAET